MSLELMALLVLGTEKTYGIIGLFNYRSLALSSVVFSIS